MPKGRNFAPATERDGNWFQHRGMSDHQKWPPQRYDQTSTGIMLTAPYKEFTAAYPPKPPKPYFDKHSKRNFKTNNTFSEHDNRHSFQDHGVYFGDGNKSRPLGKRLHSADERLHFTDKDQLKHYGRQVTNYDYNTSYASTYQGKATGETPGHRRFPKVHEERCKSGGTDGKLNTTTTDWFREPDVPYKTPLQVLATSQEPFAPHNSWKYSNHGLSRCYPPYDNVNKARPLQTWLLQGPIRESSKPLA